MFDENNIVVRELYKNDSCSQGRHEMEFKFDATEYTDEFYYVRLLENGEIMVELLVETPGEIRRG